MTRMNLFVAAAVAAAGRGGGRQQRRSIEVGHAYRHVVVVVVGVMAAGCHMGRHGGIIVAANVVVAAAR